MMLLLTALPQLDQAIHTIDWFAVLRTVLIFAVVVFAGGTVLRMIFGKGSNLNRAVSASVTILLIYLTSILIYLFLPEHRAELPALPFITVNDTRFILWQLSGLSDSLLYGSVLKLAVLAFLVNLLEVPMPEGKNFFTWYLWRMATVFAALVSYSILCGFLEKLLPSLFTEWAKPIVIGFWGVILLSGVLKLLLSVILTVMNPIIGALYTFFFSNLIGRQFSKSILTTLILVALVAALSQIGFVQFAFSDFSLAVYGPACGILVLTLYLFGKFL